MTDILIGLVGADYVLIATDSSASRSIVVFKDDEDKIIPIDSHKLMGTAGTPGDRVTFGEYIQRNIHLYQLRNAVPISTHATAHFTRTQLATALRRNPYTVNMLLGGYDEGKGPSLYWMDYLASMHPVDFGAHGYASYFVYSTLDRNYRKGMTLDEGMDLLRKCVDELRQRFLINAPKFKIKVADKDGIRELKL